MFFIEPLIFFGAGLAFVFALGQLWRKWKPENLVLSSLLLTVCVIELFLYLWFSGNLIRLPFFYPLLVPFVFFIGPLFYLYLFYLTHDTLSLRPLLMVHFIPGILMGAVAFSGQLWPGEATTAVIARGLANPEELGLGPLRGILFAGILMVQGYFIYFLQKFVRIWKPGTRKDRKMLHIFLVTLSAVLLASAIFLFLLENIQAFGRLSGVLISILFVYIYILSQRHPELLLFLVQETKKNRYEKSQIKNIDLNALQEQLRSLMEEEKIFCDEDLSLKKLAAELDITAHQLSEFLNEVMKLSFKGLLHKYRVQEAERLLVAEPDRSTLSIGLAVGYNSSSAFHAAFRRETGQSPGKFRKDRLKTAK